MKNVGIRQSRRAIMSRLRDTRRVHAPEHDMRMQLPHRLLLLQNLARPPRGARARGRRPHVANALHAAAVTAAAAGDEKGLCATLRTTGELGHAGVLRGVCVTAIRATRKEMRLSDIAMRGLERSGALEILNERGLGRVLDVIIGARLDMGDVNGAFRGERIARLMEVRLGRGTYARLIERCGDVGMGLGILHRAVGVGVVPNGRMWNCVLEMCVRERDGCRARAVLRELREMGAVNGETRRILLEAARDAEAVAEVRGVAGGGGDVAVAFARVGDWKACFEEVELGVNREHLEMIIRLACGGERMEVACRAWREMRRAWMGAPEGRTRRMLVWKLTVRGGYRDAELMRRLVTEAKECVTE